MITKVSIYLPHEIMDQIFEGLDVDTQKAAALVSSYWRERVISSARSDAAKRLQVFIASVLEAPIKWRAPVERQLRADGAAQFPLCSSLYEIDDYILHKKERCLDVLKQMSKKKISIIASYVEKLPRLRLFRDLFSAAVLYREMDAEFALSDQGSRQIALGARIDQLIQERFFRKAFDLILEVYQEEEIFKKNKMAAMLFKSLLKHGFPRAAAIIQGSFSSENKTLAMRYLVCFSTKYRATPDCFSYIESLDDLSEKMWLTSYAVKGLIFAGELFPALYKCDELQIGPQKNRALGSIAVAFAVRMDYEKAGEVVVCIEGEDGRDDAYLEIVNQVLFLHEMDAAAVAQSFIDRIASEAKRESGYVRLINFFVSGFLAERALSLLPKISIPSAQKAILLKMADFFLFYERIDLALLCCQYISQFEWRDEMYGMVAQRCCLKDRLSASLELLQHLDNSDAKIRIMRNLLEICDQGHNENGCAAVIHLFPEWDQVGALVEIASRALKSSNVEYLARICRVISNFHSDAAIEAFSRVLEMDGAAIGNFWWEVVKNKIRKFASLTCLHNKKYEAALQFCQQISKEKEREKIFARIKKQSKD